MLKTPAVQSWMGKKVASTLSDRLTTRIEVDRVTFSLLDRISLKGLLVMDRQRDTILYAQRLALRVTDWFFIKDSVDLTHIELDQALVRLHRTDSIWRHQFLIDYFISGVPNRNKTEKKRVPLHLHQLSLRSLRFEQTDGWEGHSLRANIAALELQADQLSTENKPIRIRSLLLDRPNIHWKSFAGINKTLLPSINQPPGSGNTSNADSLFRWGIPNLQVGQMEIKNGSLTVARQDRVLVAGQFDAKQPAISNLNLLLSHTSLQGDTFRSTLTLSAKERSGFAIKNLESSVQWMPGQLQLDSFILQTNHSLVKQRMTIHFPYDSLPSTFLKASHLEMQIMKSRISSKDIAFFLPAAANFNKDVQLQARISGDPGNLHINKLFLQTGSNSFFQGDLHLKNLTDLPKIWVDVQVKRMNTSYQDLTLYVPSLKKQNLSTLSHLRYIRFQGALTGQQREIVVNGNWQTGLGSLATRVQLRMPASRPVEYQGSLDLAGFELGELLEMPSLGRIDFKGAVSGKGLQLSNAETKVEGSIASVQYNNYTYRDIQLAGSLLKGSARFKTRLQDPHLVTGPLEASFTNRDGINTFIATGKIEKADLKELGLSGKNIQLTGFIDSDIRYADKETVDATLAFRNAAVVWQEELLPLDSLVVQINNTAEQKNISVASNEFNASLKGRFRMEDLGLIGQDFLARYYPSQFSPTPSLASHSQLSFSLQTSLFGPFLSAIAPGWSGLNYSHIEGSWSSSDRSFLLKANIPELRYQQYLAERIALNSSAANDRLELAGSISQIKINDTISLPPLTLQFAAKNDSSTIQLRSGKGSGFEKLNLNALVTTFKDGFVLHWDPSDFTINGKLWTLGEEGELVLRKNIPVSGSLLLSEGEQQLSLRTLSKEADQKDRISLEFSNINLNDFAPFVLPDNRLEGVVSGNLLIEDPVGNLRISSGPISTRLLRLDNDSIGELSAQLTYDQKSGQLRAMGATINEQERLSFDVLLATKDALNNKNKIALNTKQYPIKLLERFLGDLFSDITGYLTGDVTIEGDLNRPAVTGKGMLSKAGLRVNYTQCYYKIEDKEIELTPSRIELNGLVLRDTITQNPIYVSGGIDHQSFYNLFYDLDISTRKPGTRGDRDNRPVQLLNTTRSDNDLFYGDVKGTALLQLRGPQSDMVMTLNATASDRDSSYVTLPPGTGRESGTADFLVERKFGTAIESEDYKQNGDNILFDLELTANPLVQVKVVLDELTGDEIKGKGSGTLKIRSGTTEPLTLRGRLGIEEGNYLFTFQSFFKKPFEIRKGAVNYIEWNGDPYDADIKFEAVYKSERVSFSPLASTLNLTADVSNARSDVYVIAKLTDKLFKPAIAFSLDFPPNSVANVNPELTLLIRQLQNNTNELNRQVTYLIVFNSFAPNELGGSLSGAGVNVSTISGILLSVLSDQINKLFSNLLRSDKYRINLNTSLYNRNLLASNSTALNLSSNVNFSIGRSFFDNRFLISTGLGMDAPLGQGTQSSVQQSILLLPDVTMEWLINPSGTIRASFFYRTNADFLTASTSASVVRSRRAGASLSYKREYDKLSDFFGGSKKKKKNTLNN
ncbi:MAG: translocation/assembly module TamB domain-containing protein [Sphingomonadales bacterium]